MRKNGGEVVSSTDTTTALKPYIWLSRIFTRTKHRHTLPQLPRIFPRISRTAAGAGTPQVGYLEQHGRESVEVPRHEARVGDPCPTHTNSRYREITLFYISSTHFSPE